jgi:hypothetical protein
MYRYIDILRFITSASLQIYFIITKCREALCSAHPRGYAHAPPAPPTGQGEEGGSGGECSGR